MILREHGLEALPRVAGRARRPAKAVRAKALLLLLAGALGSGCRAIGEAGPQRTEDPVAAEVAGVVEQDESDPLELSYSSRDADEFDWQVRDRRPYVVTAGVVTRLHRPALVPVSVSGEWCTAEVRLEETLRLDSWKGDRVALAFHPHGIPFGVPAAGDRVTVVLRLDGRLIDVQPGDAYERGTARSGDSSPVRTR